MANSPEAPAPTTSPTATATAPVAAPAAEIVKTEGPETVVAPEKAASVVTAFKKYSPDELAQFQEGIRAKLSTNPRVGPDAALNAVDPKTVDTLPIEEETPANTETSEVKPEEPAPLAGPGLTPELEIEVDPEPESNGKLPQQRLRATNPVDDMALTLYRKANAAGKPLTLGEAEIKAKEILGVNAPENTPALKSVEVAQQELNALREKRKEAKAAFDVDAESEAQTAIEEKLVEISDLKQEAITRQQAEQRRAISVYENARAEASKLYPALLEDGKEGRKLSEMSKAAAEIHAALVASGDPSVKAPDYLLDLARRAAKQTGTPPVINGKAPVAPKTVSRPSVQPAKPQAPLLSPSARTTQPSQGQNLKAALGKASPRQLDSLVEKVAELVGRH